MQKKISISYFTSIIFSLIGIISSLYLFRSECPDPFQLIFLIPLTYSIVNIIFNKITRNPYLSSPFGLLYNGMMLLRCVVMPVLIALSDYYVEVPVLNQMPYAIKLFIYEIIIEYIFINFLINHRGMYKSKNFVMANSLLIKKNDKLVIPFFVIALLICLVLCPTALHMYRPVFGIFTDKDFAGFSSVVAIRNVSGSFISKFGIVTFQYLFRIFRIILPVMYLINTKRKEKSIVFLNYVGLSCVMNFLFVSSAIAESPINILINLIFYAYYTKNRKFLYWPFIISAVFVFMYMCVRVSLDSVNNFSAKFREISAWLQAYFGGLINIAGGLKIGSIPFLDKIQLFLYDILRGIPYGNTIFQLKSSVGFTQIFNSSMDVAGQITPTLITSKIYFGTVLAPLYPLIFIWISFRSSASISQAVKPIQMLKYIFISVYTFLGTCMYGVEITWVYLLPGVIILELLSIIVESDKNVEYDKK